MAKQPKKPAAKKQTTKAKKAPPDWVAVLRSGADGVKKWNKLTTAERKTAKLAGADLSGCDLTGANLNSVNAERANFTGAILTRVRLDRGDFEKARFANADLTEANCQFTTASDADFTGAKLVRADLRNSGLTQASFAGVDLTGAKLDEAEVRGSDFSTATLADATWNAAKFDKDTKWPAGFAIPGELLWSGRGTDPRLSGKGKSAIAADINGLMARLHATIDPKRMQRTLDMLKKGKNQIFSEIEPTMVRGIVRSQTEEDLVYSCVLIEDGTYSCATPDLAECMGLRGEPCKHLLVLLIGLARAGELDPTTADRWVTAARGKNHKWNKTVKNHISDSLLKYKGVQAGDIDWRPTETIPEDFYAM